MPMLHSTTTTTTRLQSVTAESLKGPIKSRKGVLCSCASVCPSAAFLVFLTCALLLLLAPREYSFNFNSFQSLNTDQDAKLYSDSSARPLTAVLPFCSFLKNPFPMLVEYT